MRGERPIALVFGSDQPRFCRADRLDALQLVQHTLRGGPR